MKLLAYGEDTLILWAIQNKLAEILSKLDDASNTDTCQAFYRPSFGRGGGPANFGEFDCILLSDHFVYLVQGENFVTPRSTAKQPYPVLVAGRSPNGISAASGFLSSFEMTFFLSFRPRVCEEPRQSIY